MTTKSTGSGSRTRELLTLAVLDVNETLIDMRALTPRFVAVGASGDLLQTWFASVLRDGFALTMLGRFSTFRDLALANLRSQLTPEALNRDIEDAAEFIVDGIAELPVHDDVADGLRALRDADLRVVTLTNGSADVSRSVFERGGVLGLVDELFDVSTTKRWKPAPEPYLDTVAKCGTQPGQAVLIAAHPWDVVGAQTAGMTGAWLNRGGGPWPFPEDRAAVVADSLPGVAAELTSRVQGYDGLRREAPKP